MSSFCTLYIGSGTTWPVRPFPSSSFVRGSVSGSRDAIKAWNKFEEVESYDAAVRVRCGTQGGFTPSTNTIVSPTPWYVFKDESERILYKRGQALHREICPDINWTSQRLLGIPTEPIFDVYPGACSEEVRSLLEEKRNIPDITDLSSVNSDPDSVDLIITKQPNVPITKQPKQIIIHPQTTTTAPLFNIMSRRSSVRYRAQPTSLTM